MNKATAIILGIVSSIVVLSAPAVAEDPPGTVDPVIECYAGPGMIEQPGVPECPPEPGDPNAPDPCESHPTGDMPGCLDRLSTAELPKIPLVAEVATSLTASANCDGVWIESAGYSPESYGILGISSNGPPQGFLTNGASFFSATSRPGEGGYQWDVWVNEGGHASGVVECGDPALPDPLPAPIVRFRIETAEPGIWDGVKLAPPW